MKFPGWARALWLRVFPGRDIHAVESVFTPSKPARINYVERPAIAKQIGDALRTPGKQLIVYGETGSGKSTLLLRALDAMYQPGGYVITRCQGGMTLDSLLRDAFDQLDAYYIDERTTSRSKQISTEAAAEFSKLRASAASTDSSSAGETGRRVLPVQLTPQRLGELMGAQSLCWLLEDFHKIPAADRTAFSQALKTFSDLSERHEKVRVVATGATESARLVVQYDREMANRVAEINVPLMTADEIGAILDQGATLLNVDFQSVRESLIRYSVGVAGVCHQLALNMCRNSEVYATQPSPVEFSSDDLRSAAQRWASESGDSLKATFGKALARQRVVRYDNGRLILQALATGPLEGMLHSEILTEIRKSEPEYPSGNLTLYLRELMEEDRGSIVRMVDEHRYRFVDPLHHTYAQLTLEEGAAPRADSFYAYVADYLERLLQESSERDATD